MMSIEDMKRIKKEQGLSYEQLSELSGVSAATLQKIFTGVTETPRHDTLAAITASLEKTLSEARHTQVQVPVHHLNEALAVPEEWHVVPTIDPAMQGHYTLDDYLALPDDKRYELIDGVIYEMSSPTGYHQIITAAIHGIIRDFILQNNGSCMPFVAPLDCVLDEDLRTVVEPDVMIVCDRDKITPARIYGAPDFVVEVLSPSTSRKDRYIKLNKYMNSGVKEYWMVDPKTKTVVVHHFDPYDEPDHYTFDDVVPITIYNGECKIDFRQIFKEASFFYDEKGELKKMNPPRGRKKKL